MTELDREQIDKDVLPFLTREAQPHVKSVALQYFLGLTGTEEGRTFVASNDKYISALVSLLDDQPAISKDAFLALVNLTTEERVSWAMLNLESQPTFLVDLLKYILDEKSIHADAACMILSNLSRPESCAEHIVKTIIANKDEVGFDRIIRVFCLENFNPKGKLHYLGPFLSNLTQIKEARGYVLDKERCVIQRLLPFTQYKDSLVRRGGIVGTLRNCCFETDYHDWLLSDKVDILPRLLLPLAGPEEFDEDDMEKLPDDLQYLEPDKEREPDPDIRNMLIESVNLLCTAKGPRLYVKDKNTYIIMRELDRWETDPVVKATLETMIQLLIGDEPEAGMENLKDVEIPADVEEKLEKARTEREKEVQKELEKVRIGAPADTEESDEPVGQIVMM